MQACTDEAYERPALTAPGTRSCAASFSEVALERLLAGSESSCVVYGMPRCIQEAGLADAEAPLEGMGDLLLRSL